MSMATRTDTQAPDHLEPITHAENQRHIRKTHRKHGHPLSGDNLRIGPNGARACRACNAAAQRACRERHRAAGPLALIAYKNRYVN